MLKVPEKNVTSMSTKTYDQIRFITMTLVTLNFDTKLWFWTNGFGVITSQRRIYNPVKHLRCSFFANKPILANKNNLENLEQFVNFAQSRQHEL